jgi:Putative zinc-finger
MPQKIVHLSDQDLVMAADGELPVQRRKAVLEHLESCPSCRERKQTIESTILEFVRARNLDLNERMTSPSGPRALLRARLAALQSDPPAASRSLWRMVPAAAAFLLATGVIAVIFVTNVSAEGPKPKARLTPGETRPITITEACRDPQAEVITEDIPEDIRRKVFSAYGIRANWDDFEVDYLITPDLGGVQSVRNIWPQPYATKWNARTKNKLEQRLHDLVCEGKIDLATAQHDIAADWIGAYKKYVEARDRR